MCIMDPGEGGRHLAAPSATFLLAKAALEPRPWCHLFSTNYTGSFIAVPMGLVCCICLKQQYNGN